MSAQQHIIADTGRRKCAIAQVKLSSGSGSDTDQRETIYAVFPAGRPQENDRAGIYSYRHGRQV